MKNLSEFPFEKARGISKEEIIAAGKAIELKIGVPRPPRGRPSKSDAEKYQPTSIRLHPKVMAWARKEARNRGIGYQTIINEALLEKTGYRIGVKQIDEWDSSSLPGTAGMLL
jgi:uncharacterized protein (DUF4415 family)